ncbi:MAG: DHHA1 domain-containing protein, partial [Nitrospirae bacterium]|nr:DHHA1 domain-containing protein [Nitrospirota bacterium]
VKVKKGILRVWNKVKCSVDAEKRRATMRNHTATHLLQASLKLLLGDHVKQAGSLVSPSRLRFDFTNFSALGDAEITALEAMVNEKILDNIPVTTTVMDIKAAVESGAIALFGEKYGESVRVVSVPGVSSELCGGTHCKATGDIGTFVVVSEASVASGIRRMEALTGKAAFEYLRGKAAEVRRLNDLLKTDQPAQRVEKLLADLKAFEKELDALKTKTAAKDSAAILETARRIRGITVVSHRVDNLEQKDLRILADTIRDKIGSGIIFVASARNGQASMLAMVTKDLTARFNAGEILKEAAAAAGGRGGGKAEMAQGGTSDLDRLDKALESVYDIIETRATRKQ